MVTNANEFFFIHLMENFNQTKTHKTILHFAWWTLDPDNLVSQQLQFPTKYSLGRTTNISNFLVTVVKWMNYGFGTQNTKIYLFLKVICYRGKNGGVGWGAHLFVVDEWTATGEIKRC